MAEPTASARQNGGSEHRRGQKRDRAISNLTEEQLQHKRNVDRKAQRAFRQRTKDTIHRLEQQIATLQETANNREARLQHDLSTLRSTNTSLLQCLEHISDLVAATTHSIGSLDHRSQNANDDSDRYNNDNDGYESDAVPAVASPANANPQSVPASIRADRTVEASTSYPDIGHSLDDSIAAIAPTQHTSAFTHPDHVLEEQARQDVPEAFIPSYFSHTGELHQLGTIKATCAPPGYPSPSASHQLQNASPETHTSSPSANRLAYGTSVDMSHEVVPSPIASDRTTAASTAYGKHSNSQLIPVSSVLPSHLPPTCPLDDILRNFLSSKREMIAQGVPAESVLGPTKPTVKALLDPSFASTVHPICAVMSEVLSTFAHVSTPEKLAFFYLMFKTMRWLILPTKESYNAMPLWLRPTVTQITVQHAAWIDNIPWPGVRDMLIEESEAHPFEVFSQYYSQNVSVNWNFDSLDAVSDADNTATLHSIFEKHVCNLKNWTVTPEFQQRFPAMTPAIYSRD